jgi:uncharacterized protein YbaR (Trm112 family)
MNAKLLGLLVCPLCRGLLEVDRVTGELICRGDAIAYPVTDGIPMLLPEQGRSLIVADAP